MDEELKNLFNQLHENVQKIVSKQEEFATENMESAFWLSFVTELIRDSNTEQIDKILNTVKSDLLQNLKETEEETRAAGIPESAIVHARSQLLRCTEAAYHEVRKAIYKLYTIK